MFQYYLYIYNFLLLPQTSANISTIAALFQSAKRKCHMQLVRIIAPASNGSGLVSAQTERQRRLKHVPQRPVGADPNPGSPCCVSSVALATESR